MAPVSSNDRSNQYAERTYSPRVKLPARADMVTSIGKGEGEVDIVAWAGYIERGATDKAYDWVTGFEKDTGCKVNVKVAGTSDEMVDLMRTGQYDGVSASGNATARLVDGGDVSPVNVSWYWARAVASDRRKPDRAPRAGPCRRPLRSQSRRLAGARRRRCRD